MKKYLPVLFFACMTFGISQACAQTVAPPSKKATKKTHAKKAAPAAKETELADDDDDAKEPDSNGSTVTEYRCELGNKLTIYRNADDDKHIALRWIKRLYRLRRVDTSTGAHRFENRKYGLVWINIPAKGMLLDSIKGNQLANECKSPEQMAIN